MAKYVYPAIFVPEENGMYSVFFPNIEGCTTCGNDLSHAIEMAAEDDAFVTYIPADTFEYRKKFYNQAVKKTLSIPGWLDEIATAAGVNFSQVL